MDYQLKKVSKYETQELLERLRGFLKYEPATGDIVFTDTRFGAVEIGQKAGGIDAHGYHRIYHKGRLYMSHRIAWALYHGEWPKGTIDHINSNKTDNRICNLRVCSSADNMKNRAPYSGKVFKGVYRTPTGWRSLIVSGGKSHYCGSFKCIGKALKAYDEKAKELHGEYAKLNLPTLDNPPRIT